VAGRPGVRNDFGTHAESVSCSLSGNLELGNLVLNSTHVDITSGDLVRPLVIIRFVGLVWMIIGVIGSLLGDLLAWGRLLLGFA
jgi:hypothetical protein